MKQVDYCPVLRSYEQAIEFIEFEGVLKNTQQGLDILDGADGIDNSLVKVMAKIEAQEYGKAAMGALTVYNLRQEEYAKIINTLGAGCMSCMFSKMCHSDALSDLAASDKSIAQKLAGIWTSP